MTPSEITAFNVLY